ncbi:MAG: ECF transporter S component [Oscillospiraceae bacterium]
MKNEAISNNTVSHNSKPVNIRALAVTGMLSALAFALMYLEFPVPLMPPFIKMDLSDFPALIAAYCFGPLWGVCVCLIKNLIHLFFSSTGGVGELANFLIGALFVIPAGLVYKLKKTRKSALIGAIIGAVVMALGSLVTNNFIVYPVYYNFMPKEAILAAYQAILPSVKTIPECLLIFNVPFTFVKAMISVIIVFPTYKYLSPILKGKNS